MNRFTLFAWFWVIGVVAHLCNADHPLAAPGVTSLTNPAVEYQVTDRHSVVLERGGVTAIIVDNVAIDSPELPGHRAGEED